MFKIKLLLTVTFFIVILSATLASRARINHVIFTRDPTKPSICNMPLLSKTMLPTPIGTFWATSVQGASCVLALTSDFND